VLDLSLTGHQGDCLICKIPALATFSDLLAGPLVDVEKWDGLKCELLKS